MSTLDDAFVPAPGRELNAAHRGAEQAVRAASKGEKRWCSRAKAFVAPPDCLSRHAAALAAGGYNPSQLAGVTLEQLSQERPDLLEEARVAASAQVEQAVAAERARVVEILEAQGDAAVTLAAVRAGTPAAEVYKQLYQAEVERRTTASAELEKTLSGESAGAAGRQKSDRAPSAEERERELTAKVKQHLAGNPGLSFEQALGVVLAANPDLGEE